MAQQKSKYTETMYLRVSKAAKEWAQNQIPARFASFAAYVDHLIKKDRKGHLPHSLYPMYILGALATHPLYHIIPWGHLPHSLYPI